MINAIIIYEGDVDLVFNDYFKIHEMKTGIYNIITSIEQLDAIEAIISESGSSITFIGCFNIDGSKVVFPEVNKHRNFSILRYTDSLLTNKTTSEARSIQVANIAGWGNRDLS
jgi:hypothetical protein